MSRARGSDVPVTTLVMCTTLLVLSFSLADAAKYTVPWSFNVSDWLVGKNFVAGDSLVFRYTAQKHDVFVVDVNGYNSCTSRAGDEHHATGLDKVVLKKGKNYFICGFPGHCNAGMKILVDAQ